MNKDEDYTMIMHPLPYRIIRFWDRLEEGPYSYVWKAMWHQAEADYKGWGING